MVMAELGGTQTGLDYSWSYGAWVRFNVYPEWMLCLAAHQSQVLLAVAEIELPMGKVAQIRFALWAVCDDQLLVLGQL